MKKIKVLFFGSISEAAGRQEEELEINGGSDALLVLVKEKYPAIGDLRFSIAVNQEITLTDKELNEGDEVALLPPFTGG